MKFFLSGLGNFSNNLSIITEAIIKGDKLGFDNEKQMTRYFLFTYGLKKSCPASFNLIEVSK